MPSDVEIIAERKILVIHETTGVRSDLTICIGRPYMAISGDAACPVEIKGASTKTRTIHGIDTLQALTLALQFVDVILKEPPVGTKYYWENEEPMN
jgi:hypothetical protein